MTEKTYCDRCGEEVKEYGCRFTGSIWWVWGLFPYWERGDFCSYQCMIKYLLEMKGGVK